MHTKLLAPAPCSAATNSGIDGINPKREAFKRMGVQPFVHRFANPEREFHRLVAFQRNECSRHQMCLLMRNVHIASLNRHEKVCTRAPAKCAATRASANPPSTVCHCCWYATVASMALLLCCCSPSPCSNLFHLHLQGWNLQHSTFISDQFSAFVIAVVVRLT